MIYLVAGKCGTPWQVLNARVAHEGSSGEKLRYACLDTFKRKAGTSSLIVCEKNPTTLEYRWSLPKLVCINPDNEAEGPIRGSVYFRVGIPFLAVILSAGFMYHCYCRRSRDPWKQIMAHSMEMIPMDPMGSEEGRPALVGDSPDPGPVNEEDPMLTGLPPPVE
ncbi:interleukin-15 receptor subunit alpha isoform X4 [Erythrolamprus reginae]|uniref:interleukin-15 receptor subunit alpha isoform X4 n=1 Tax=Erythrolamprus reginae TaxID=121349 RepID=UPI00396CEDFF